MEQKRGDWMSGGACVAQQDRHSTGGGCMPDQKLQYQQRQPDQPTCLVVGREDAALKLGDHRADRLLAQLPLHGWKGSVMGVLVG